MSEHEERACTMAEARAAKDLAQKVFASIGTVVGVGIVRAGDGYGLKVNLEKSLPAGTNVPTEVDGVPVRIEVVGLPKKR